MWYGETGISSYNASPPKKMPTRPSPYDAVTAFILQGVRTEARRWITASAGIEEVVNDVLGPAAVKVIGRVMPENVPDKSAAFWIRSAQFEARKYLVQQWKYRTPQRPHKE